MNENSKTSAVIQDTSNSKEHLRQSVVSKENRNWE